MATVKARELSSSLSLSLSLNIDNRRAGDFGEIKQSRDSTYNRRRTIVTCP